MTVLLAGASFLFGGLTTVSSQAEELHAAVSIDDVRAGFDGFYKVGEWSPVFVTVTAAVETEARLVVEVPDVDADLTILASEPVALAAGVPQRLEGMFKTGQLNGSLRIRIESDGKTVASKTLRTETDAPAFRPGLVQSQKVWVAIGEPAGLGNDAGQASSPEIAGPENENRTVAKITAADLPTSWHAFSSIDTLILATASVTPDEKPLPEQLSAAQNSALSQWVHRGGYLVISVGSAVPSYLDSPLARWIPVPVKGQGNDRQLSELETIAGGNEPLRKFRSVKTALFGDIDGLVVKRGINGPTLVRVTYGFGRVTFLAVDLNRPPIQGWKAAHLLLEQVVEGKSRTRQLEQNNRSSQLSSLGVTDLASQFHAIQQDMDDVGRVSVWTVMGLTILYLLIIGPVDYWVVHKIFKRPEFTWVTFPLLVATAGALSIWTSTTINGNFVSLKQTNVVDIDARTGQFLTQSWIGFHSPDNARYTLTATPEKLTAEKLTAEETEASKMDADVTLSWAAMAEDRIGGLNRQGGGIQLANRSYRYGPATASLEEIPVQQWSAKNFVASWTGQQADLVQSTLHSPGPGRLQGYVSHKLSVPLEDCLLAYGSQVYRMETLAPHQQWSPSPLQSRGLRSFLTGTISKKIDGADFNETQFIEESAQYDPLGRDAETVARMLTFHQSAGGTAYTGMAHEVCPELDLTEHLKLGRAILFAKAKLPTTQILVNGAPAEKSSQQTFIRIIFSVKDTQPEGVLRKIPHPAGAG